MGAATYRHEGFKLARIYWRQSRRNARTYADALRADPADAMKAHHAYPQNVRLAVGVWVRAWCQERKPRPDDWARMEQRAAR